MRTLSRLSNDFCFGAENHPPFVVVEHGLELCLSKWRLWVHCSFLFLLAFLAALWASESQSRFPRWRLLVSVSCSTLWVDEGEAGTREILASAGCVPGSSGWRGVMVAASACYRMHMSSSHQNFGLQVCGMVSLPDQEVTSQLLGPDGPSEGSRSVSPS